MLGTFSYVNPTKLYFGEDALDSLPGELARYGDRVASRLMDTKDTMIIGFAGGDVRTRRNR